MKISCANHCRRFCAPLILTVLLFCGCDLIISPEEHLFEAVYENREEEVAAIIKNGKVKNIDEIFNHATSLHFAAKNGNAKIIYLLINAGANVNAISKGGESTPLSTAVLYGRRDVVSDLIKYGADKDFQDTDFKFTPTIDALRKGHIDIAKLLVENGANACIKNANGHDALSAANAYGLPEFYEWYEENGFPKCN